MSPLIDLIGSVKGYGWGGLLPTGDFDSISTITVGAGGSATIAFNSIPQEYTHLQIRSIAQNSSVNMTFCKINFNGDTATNYSWHELGGNGSTATSVAAASTAFGVAFDPIVPNSVGAFGAGITDILDYSNASKNKTIRALSGVDRNGSGNIFLISSLWRNTSAITSIVLTSSSGNFTQNSFLALYGIK
jgi:hypothetical protein